jgi:hypothetical protein
VSGNNNNNHDKVEANITTKKDLSNSHVAKEVVIQVREVVQKLGKGTLVEVNSGLMEVISQMVRTCLNRMDRRSGVASHYASDEFKMSNADEFEDTQHSGKGAGNDYLEKGTISSSKKSIGVLL